MFKRVEGLLSSILTTMEEQLSKTIQDKEVPQLVKIVGGGSQIESQAEVKESRVAKVHRRVDTDQ